MEKADFIKRLVELRMDKGVSARDMSLSIGQSAGYINNIENGTNYPSMTVFFYICEYLNITPQQFFDEGNAYPDQLAAVIENLKRLDAESLSQIAGIVEKLAKQ